MKDQIDDICFDLQTDPLEDAAAFVPMVKYTWASLSIDTMPVFYIFFFAFYEGVKTKAQGIN